MRGGSWDHASKIVTLHTQALQTLAQVHSFVSGVDPISFTLKDHHATYRWMADTLRQFGYGRCKRADKVVLWQYLLKVTGLSIPCADGTPLVTTISDAVGVLIYFSIAAMVLGA